MSNKENFFYKRDRVTCRAIIVKDNKILLTFSKNEDIYMLPGGGKEDDESIFEGTVREVKEESGYVVKPIKDIFNSVEIYKEIRFLSHFTVCELTPVRVERQLTEYEIECGTESVWMDLESAIKMFAKYDDYKLYEKKYVIYKREYIALQEYCKVK